MLRVAQALGKGLGASHQPEKFEAVFGHADAKRRRRADKHGCRRRDDERKGDGDAVSPKPLM
jgi:hypothetical protein